MGDTTRIAWTDHTLNFWMGCFKVSQGCKHCYADTLTTKKMKLDVFGHNTDKRKRTGMAVWNRPIRWNREAIISREPARVFVMSLGDFFEDAPQLNEWREEAWNVIRANHWLDFQILTKRPENIERMLPDDWDNSDVGWVRQGVAGSGGVRLGMESRGKAGRGEASHKWPYWPHVWLGVSVENNAVAHRADTLTEIPAHVHFISYEPAIGPGDEINLEGIEWMIVGGESGPKRRKMDLQWARDMQDRCLEEGVAYFFKQDSAPRTEMGIDALGGIYRDYPESWDRKVLVF